MTSLVALIPLFGIALVAIVLVQKWLAPATEQPSYKSKPLLSANEKEFYQRLSQALPDFHVFTQVALGALLQPSVRNNNRAYYRARGAFSQKIADYVICDEDLCVVAVVELDDKTHNQDRDAKRDAMLTQAGYRVVRWRSNSKPTLEQIREKLQS